MPMITSIHGRRFGLTETDAVLTRQRVTGTDVAGTSDSTGTALANSGVVSVVTTTNDGWTLTAPEIGSVVTLVTGSSSTGTHSIALTGSVAYTTNGIAGSTAALAGAGASLTLFGLTTAIWLQIGRSGSTASAYISS